MKLLAIILLALLCAVPGMATKDTDAAYVDGVIDGYTFGYLAVIGQTNITAEMEYNTHVRVLNAWMDKNNYTGERWASLVKAAPTYQLPPIFATRI